MNVNDKTYLINLHKTVTPDSYFCVKYNKHRKKWQK